MEDTRRLFIEITFDGSNYFGWQEQKHSSTVQETIQNILSTVYDQKIKITGCGRTDAKVHANQYFFHFDTSKKRAHLKSILNKMLPKDIYVKQCIPCSINQHARFDAAQRTYWYFLDGSYNVFRRNISWTLDLESLNHNLIHEACKLFLQHNNYKRLSKHNPENNNQLSDVTQAEWCYFKADNKAIFKVAANRFLHNQVRRMLACLINIGTAKISLKQLQEALNKETPLPYNNIAPPQGLFLWQIKYPFI